MNTDLSLPLINEGLEVDGEDRSSCLSSASLIRCFRSSWGPTPTPTPTSDLEPPTPLSLYIFPPTLPFSPINPSLSLSYLSLCSALKTASFRLISHIRKQGNPRVCENQGILYLQNQRERERERDGFLFFVMIRGGSQLGRERNESSSGRGCR